MPHHVYWHGRCCEEGEPFPHAASESANVRTLADAIDIVPRGTIGYVNWSEPRRRWLIQRDGTIDDHRERKRRSQ